MQTKKKRVMEMFKGKGDGEEYHILEYPAWSNPH